MAESQPPVVVSACLLGLACRYDGSAKPNAAVTQALTDRAVILVCPETAAGLGVPRPPIAFSDGDGARVVRTGRGLSCVDGVDVAARLVPAARRLVAVARSAGAREAILKERSPSCGVRFVHRGDEVVPGAGVFATLLKDAHVHLRTEEDLAGADGRAAAGDACGAK